MVIWNYFLISASPTLKWLIFLSNLSFLICQWEVQDPRQENSTIFYFLFLKGQTVTITKSVTSLLSLFPSSTTQNPALIFICDTRQGDKHNPTQSEQGLLFPPFPCHVPSTGTRPLPCPHSLLSLLWHSSCATWQKGAGAGTGSWLLLIMGHPAPHTEFGINRQTRGKPWVQVFSLFSRVRFLTGCKQLEDNSEETHLSNDAEPVFSSKSGRE